MPLESLFATFILELCKRKSLVDDMVPKSNPMGRKEKDLRSLWPWSVFSASATIFLPRVTSDLHYVCFVFLICLFVILGMLLTKPQGTDATPQKYYASSALTYLLAMVSSNMALRWVTYPTQVVAKSAKPIPVMLLGVLIGRKSYSLQKYMYVFVIVLGVVLFMFEEGRINKSQEHESLGMVLVLLSLSMDGLTGAIQERMRASAAPSAQQMMLAMNGWSTVIIGAALVLTGEAVSFVGFAVKYPQMLTHLASLALAGAFGQLFIFMMVSHYGPLPCSIVTTTRKFFTVLFSVIWFGNSLTNRQWFGAILVFVGLFADMFGKKPPPKPKEEGSPKVHSSNNSQTKPLLK